MEKMTLEQFVKQYSHSAWDDEEYADAIVRHLPQDLPVVKASQAFLEACKAFDAAMAAAGVERD